MVPRDASVFAKPKQFRAIAIHHKNTASNFLGG